MIGTPYNHNLRILCTLDYRISGYINKQHRINLVFLAQRFQDNAFDAAKRFTLAGDHESFHLPLCCQGNSSADIQTPRLQHRGSRKLLGDIGAILKKQCNTLEELV